MDDPDTAEETFSTKCEEIDVSLEETRPSNPKRFCKNRLENDKALAPASVEPGYFEKLPDELMLQILSKISLQDRATKMSLVSRQFRRLCFDKSLGKELNFSDFDGKWEEMPFAEILRVFDYHPLLNNLDVKFIESSMEVAIYALEKCPKLKELNVWVDGNRDKDRENYLFASIKEHGKSLRDLNIVRGGVWAINNASCLKNLTKLNLAQNTQFNNGLKAIGDNCKHLQHLDIAKIWEINDDAMKYFLDKVQGTLKSLRVFAYMLTDSSLRDLSKCQRLETISGAVNYSSFVFQSISELKNLKILSLYGSLQMLSKDRAFRNNKFKGLVNLIATGWKLDNEGLVTIAENCPLLTVLTVIGWKQVTDFGVKYLLLKSPKLRKFSIYGSAVTKDAFENIQAPLRNLGIFLALVQKEALHELRVKYPRIKIESTVYYD